MDQSHKTIAVLFKVDPQVDPKLYVEALVELLRNGQSAQVNATRVAMDHLTISAAYGWSIITPIV